MGYLKSHNPIYIHFATSPKTTKAFQFQKLLGWGEDIQSSVCSNVDTSTGNVNIEEAREYI